MMVRRAESGDARRVFEIRNHPQSRVFFHHQEPLVWEDHLAWFGRQYVDSKVNMCLVAETDGTVNGYCRLDARADGGCLLSVAVDPEARGRGIGSALVREALLQIPSGDKVYAEVLTGNAASRALMEKTGFQLERETEAVAYFIHRNV
ncbi:GNAT family N-acetyltransferase [Patescibacteria group bacterium]|jgi:ribosomal protein S18 acetylase RimI-like enzyme|nr:GNAT family N-acetyltransferase [Patescibacteria group bacterium]